MSDFFYKTIRFIGTPIFWSSSKPVVIGLENIPATGSFLLASNHTSPYDIALLIRHVPRLLDFVSSVEVFRNPIVARFYGSMNAFPLDRSKPDAPTVRTILNRLERARPVVIFPEGRFRRAEHSVVHTRTIRPGIGRIATIAKVPIIPTILINSSTYSRPTSWFPLFKTRYAVAFGPPIPSDLPSEEIEAALIESLVSLYNTASAQLPAHCRVL